MKLPKLREVAEAVSALVHRPYTSPFPRVPHVANPKFRGQPKYDRDQCVGCLACERRNGASGANADQCASGSAASASAKVG